MNSSAVLRLARLHGWEPTNPNDLIEYLRCLDREKPGDDEFLLRLACEALVWCIDNEINR